MTNDNDTRAIAAPEWLTWWQAERRARYDNIIVPVSGDATTRAREYPKGWRMADCL